MARQPRLDLPGIPQHLVQCGNDRQACFAADAEYLRYLQEVREASAKHDCAIDAYVLMTEKGDGKKGTWPIKPIPTT